MRQIDRLIIKEILGPWVFGVGLFAALLMAATYLGRLAEYIAGGIPIGSVIEMTLLLLPAILVKTFTMSVLLAGLLGFGRLSSDSEIVALRAGGSSIFRIVMPVVGFSLVIALIAFGFNEKIVPAATRRSFQIVDEIAKNRQAKGSHPVETNVVQKQKLQLHIVAADTDLATRTFRRATVIAYDDHETPSAILIAKELEFNGVDAWRVRGGAKLIDLNTPGLVTDIAGDIYPKNLPKINRSLSELIAPKEDQDGMTMSELSAMIDRHIERGDKSTEDIRNFQYWYWNKISVPLAAIIFGALGAVLGIRNHRTGTAAGFALAVGIIFGYVTLMNFLNVWAMKGVLPSWGASFAPLIVGTIAAAIITWRRNG